MEEYTKFPWGCQGNFLCDINPFTWVGLGLGLSLALSVLGASWGRWTRLLCDHVYRSFVAVNCFWVSFVFFDEID